MRDVIAIAMILLVGFLTGLLILTHVPAIIFKRTEFNWSQQSLRDPAQDACPNQYREYGADEHGQFLISCWGHKDEQTSNLDADRSDYAREPHTTYLYPHPHMCVPTHTWVARLHLDPEITLCGT